MVEVRDNFVKTEHNDDYAYVAVSGSVISGNSGNNKVGISYQKNKNIIQLRIKNIDIIRKVAFRTARWQLSPAQASAWFSLGSNPWCPRLLGQNAEMHRSNKDC